MPKSRQKKSKHRNKPGSLLLNVSRKLEEIDDLVESGEFADALSQLEFLGERYPHRADIFANMLSIAIELKDDDVVLKAAQRLTDLQPAVPEHQLALFGAYLANLFPALGSQAGHRFLERWPNHGTANTVRRSLDELEVHLRTEAENLHVQTDDWKERLCLHERVQIAMDQGQYREAHRLATELIGQMPEFVPAYNNRSLANWEEDQRDAAIADARRAVELDPDNIHALSNLTRFLHLTNNALEAGKIAERLKSARPTVPEAWAKKAEAFSYLCDDVAVLEIAKQADKAGALFGKSSDPYLLHFAGVAAARSGEARTARRFWDAALDIAPDFQLAQEQLDDLDKPAGERLGAWPFNLQDWTSVRRVDELEAQLKPKSSGQRIRDGMDHYLRQHPELRMLVPVLLERGDTAGRAFAVLLAQFSRDAELQDELKKFISGQNGSDQDRRKAALGFVELGVFEKGRSIRLWVGEKQCDVVLNNYQIDHQPYEKLPSKAREASELGFEALVKGDLDRAEQCFSRALAVAPGSPTMQFNLAAVKLRRRRVREAREAFEQIASQHPTYVFPLCELAMVELANGRVERAREILDRLAGFDHFHVAEFVALCRTNALYSIVVESGREGASQWLDMWEDFVPDDPKLDLMRQVVEERFHSGAMANRLLSAYLETAET